MADFLKLEHHQNLDDSAYFLKPRELTSLHRGVLRVPSEVSVTPKDLPLWHLVFISCLVWGFFCGLFFVWRRGGVVVWVLPFFFFL